MGRLSGNYIDSYEKNTCPTDISDVSGEKDCVSVDLIEIRIQEQTLRLIQQINNSDKGSGNTLQSSSQATGKNQKSTVSELY